MIINSSFRQDSQSEKGQSLVEVAITLTVIIILLAGAFDLGTAFFYSVALRDAAQEGAVYGAINPTDTSGIEGRIRQSSSEPINFLSDPKLREPEITISGTACAGGAITVTLIYDYQISMPFLGSILNSQTIPLKASVTNTILTPACSP
ncbi:MAG: pilus assembly protein [Chloroflexi bacterium]|nr:pilus assembly protein [Chloroflexota bacterium]